MPLSTFLAPIIAASILITPTSYSLGDLKVTLQGGFSNSAYTVTPSDDLLEVDPETFDGEVEKFQFTEKQVEEANKTTVALLVKDFINSPALNATRAEYNTFVQTRTGYSTDLIGTMKAPETPGTPYVPVIPLTTPETLLPTFTEDYLPSMGDTNIELEKVSATEYKKKPQLVLQYGYEAPYRVTDEAVLDYVRLLNSVKTDSVDRLVKDKIFEPGDDNSFLVDGTVSFTVQKNDDKWEVVSVQTAYQYDVTDFAKVQK